MELYTLHLHKALRYERLSAPSLEAFLSQADASGEGSERLAVWDSAALIVEGEDGPRLREPLAAPLWTGSAAPEPGESGLGPIVGEGAALSLAPDTKAFALGQGSYIFCQARAAGVADLRDTLEWFVRESWWIGAGIQGRLYLRLVREDGKTAVQALARNAQP